MYKKILVLCLSLACITSCTKDETESLSNNEVQVQFNVKTLNVDVEPIVRTRTTSTASSVLNSLQYWFYNGTTRKIIQGSQSLATDGDKFGTLSLMLSPGDYYGMIWGTNANNADGTFSIAMGDSYTSTSKFTMFDKEVFFNNTKYTITAATKNQDVTLSRLVGKLVLKLTDTSIPTDVAKIKISFGYYKRWAIYDDEATTDAQGFQDDFSKELTYSSTSIDEFDLFMLPQSNKTMIISIFDASGNQMASTNVPFSIYKNKRTVISGNLFDVLNQRPFTVNVVDTWDEDVNVPLQ